MFFWFDQKGIQDFPSYFALCASYLKRDDIESSLFKEAPPLHLLQRGLKKEVPASGQPPEVLLKRGGGPIVCFNLINPV